MPLTRAEAKRADEIEAAGRVRRLTREELAEYGELAMRSYNRKRRQNGQPPDDYPFIPKGER